MKTQILHKVVERGENPRFLPSLTMFREVFRASSRGSEVEAEMEVEVEMEMEAEMEVEARPPTFFKRALLSFGQTLNIIM
jgi:hypothetical protein